MIIPCSYEELMALTSGAERVLGVLAGGTGVLAPPEETAEVEALLSRLDGDLEVHTLAEQQRVAHAVELILETLRERMDEAVLTQHVGAEDAVVAYFDYAHVLTIDDRLSRVGAQMTGMIELMTGAPPDEDTAREINFGD